MVSWRVHVILKTLELGSTHTSANIDKHCKNDAQESCLKFGLLTNACRNNRLLEEYGHAVHTPSPLISNGHHFVQFFGQSDLFSPTLLSRVQIYLALPSFNSEIFVKNKPNDVNQSVFFLLYGYHVLSLCEDYSNLCKLISLKTV